MDPSDDSDELPEESHGLVEFLRELIRQLIVVRDRAAVEGIAAAEGMQPRPTGAHCYGHDGQLDTVIDLPTRPEVIWRPLGQRLQAHDFAEPAGPWPVEIPVAPYRRIAGDTYVRT